MKDQVYNLFASIEMPGETEQRLRMAMEEKHNHRRKLLAWARPIATMAVMLAFVLTITPIVRAAANEWMVKYFWADSDITIYKVQYGDVEATVAVVDTEAPVFARMVNGRLYFLGNGEKTDITDQITEASPYYYSYVDEYGLTHDMAVGYSDTMDNFGVYEFIWKEEAGEKVWNLGTGRNFLDAKTKACYPWVEIVWKDLEIPWEMPGA